MAYKNQKKNKKHKSEIRKINSRKKRETENNHNAAKVWGLTEDDYLRIMKQQRLI